MLSNHQHEVILPHSSLDKVRGYTALLKVRLSGLVVFSGAFGFGMAVSGSIDWLRLAMFCLATFMITGAANIINQIIEKDLDRLMNRTKGRPLPSGLLSVNEALGFCLILAGLGSGLLFIFTNYLTLILALLSMLLYGFAYTPLKQKSPIAVFVGAFPGAFPPMIGYVAVSGEITSVALLIFAIQFIWQFPHFWAIAWVGDDDYRKAGFRLLPNGEKNLNTSVQIMAYTMLLIPLGLLPWYLGISGIVSAVVLTVAGILFMLPALELIGKGDRKSALKLMFASFLYLPASQLAMLFDKI